MNSILNFKFLLSIVLPVNGFPRIEKINQRDGMPDGHQTLSVTQ